MRFGFYISILEVPLELIIGRINTPAVFVSGGLSACLCDPHGPLKSHFGKFLGSGVFIGLIGLYMNRGNDKA